MRTEELKEIYEALIKDTSNLDVLANIVLFKQCGFYQSKDDRM